jgi:hypothetical protein
MRFFFSKKGARKREDEGEREREQKSSQGMIDRICNSEGMTLIVSCGATAA